MKDKFLVWDSKFYKLVKLFSILVVIFGAVVFFSFSIANDQPEIGIPCLCAALILAGIIEFKLFLAGHFYSIALIKGYRDTIYLKLAFFTVLAGYLLVIALPDRNSQTTPIQNQQFTRTTTFSNDLPEL